MTSVFNKLLRKGQSSSKSEPTGHKAGNRPVDLTGQAPPRPVATSYTSKQIEIPDEFLTTTPQDARPITISHIDFEKTPLPEYKGHYAVVLDNVLSPSECTELQSLAEASAGADDASVEKNGWRPAMVNSGPGMEVLMTKYRNSDRIIWDNPTVVQRIWLRCQQAPGNLEELNRLENNPTVQGTRAANLGEKWKVIGLNERMRFLRYGAGQYFRAHCDGPYFNPKNDFERSFYTLHLYLNDSVQALESGNRSCQEDPAISEPLKGGATTFHAVRDEQRHLDVDPKAGRVLIFQHEKLLHSGDDVTSGVKYTLRTDLMFDFEHPL